jgi:hypothetical protein
MGWAGKAQSRWVFLDELIEAETGQAYWCWPEIHPGQFSRELWNRF